MLRILFVPLVVLLSLTFLHAGQQASHASTRALEFSADAAHSGSQVAVQLGPSIGLPYWLAVAGLSAEAYSGPASRNASATEATPQPQAVPVWDLIDYPTGDRPSAAPDLFRPDAPADLPPGEALQSAH